MDCSRCERMLDDPDRALADAAARVVGGSGADELSPCCVETLELLRLERGMRAFMPAAEPHSSLDAMILKAAAARVAGTNPAVAAVAATVPEAPLSAPSWADRLRAWVTAPQVAMATITALAVVIGVFYVPSHRSPMEARGDTVMSVPSAASPDGELTAEATPLELSAPLPSPASAKPDLNAQNAPSSATVALLAQATDDSEVVDEDAQPTDVRADDVLAMAEVAAAPRDELDRMQLAPSPVAPATTPAPAAAATGRAAAARSLGDSTSSGLVEAASEPAPATDALVRARVARSRGQCAAAIPLYEQWLESPEPGPRGEAMLELAGCYASTGRTDRARRLYERATGVPQVASRARSELDSLESPPAASTRARAGESSRATGGSAPASPPATSDAY